MCHCWVSTNLCKQYIDMVTTKIQVVENADPDCKVLAEVTNIGNNSTEITIRLEANVNGNSLLQGVTRFFEAGQTYHILFNSTIPKSPTRQYVGSCKATSQADIDHSNDQTSVVEVINYYNPAGIPTAETSQLVLDQNYPNPFEHTTTVPFTLPEAANVRFFIIDALGHMVQRSERFYQAGEQSIVVDMASLPAGIYYYGIEVDGKRLMRKMIMR